MAEEKVDPNVSPDALRELRNDFTFFMTMSMLKTMAVSAPDPKEFVRSIIWKWRELQVNAMSVVTSDYEKRMAQDEDFNAIFGEFMKKVNKTQREMLIASIRAFCDGIERVLVDSIDKTDEAEKGEDFEF